MSWFVPVRQRFRAILFPSRETAGRVLRPVSLVTAVSAAVGSPFGSTGTFQMLLTIARPAQASFVPSLETASCFTKDGPAPPMLTISTGGPSVFPVPGENPRRKISATKFSERHA